MYETLQVDGIDLATVVTCITSLSGIYTVGNVRGSNIQIPGVDGELWLDRPYDTNTIELGLVLAGSTTTEFNDSYRVLKTLIRPGKKLQLVRKLSYTTGDELQVASGEYAGGLNPGMSLMRYGRVTVSFKIHDGLWYAPASDCFTTNVPATVEGETRTHRMTVTMPYNGTLTNSSNGHTLTMAVVGSTANVDIDVESMTAMQGATDVSYAMSWNSRLPMRLEPGVNTFTGSTATICYWAAYL